MFRNVSIEDLVNLEVGKSKSIISIKNALISICKINAEQVMVVIRTRSLTKQEVISSIILDIEFMKLCVESDNNDSDLEFFVNMLKSKHQFYVNEDGMNISLINDYNTRVLKVLNLQNKVLMLMECYDLGALLAVVFPSNNL